MKLNIKKAVLGAVGGCAAGMTLGVIKMATASVAPISYPALSSLGTGLMIKDILKECRAKEITQHYGAVVGGLVGLGVGTACIPLAPVVFVTALPINTVGWTVAGAMVGALQK